MANDDDPHDNDSKAWYEEFSEQLPDSPETSAALELLTGIQEDQNDEYGFFANEYEDDFDNVMQPRGWARKYPEGQEPDDELEQRVKRKWDFYTEHVVPEYHLGIKPRPKMEKIVELIWHDVQQGLSTFADPHETWTSCRLTGPPREMSNNMTLSDYQLEDIGAASHIDNRDQGCMLLQDMGQGKTVQSLTLHFVNKVRGPALVVCPASILPVWKQEFDRFFPDRTYFEYKYSKENPQTAEQLMGYDVVFVSYHRVATEYRDRRRFAEDQELRMQDIVGVGRITKEEKARARRENRSPRPPPRRPRTDFPQGLLHAIYWDRVILDEAHRLRNDGFFAESCHALKRRTCTLATGTPQQNNFPDWLPLLRMMRREYAFAFKHFFEVKQAKDAEWGPLEQNVSIALGVIVRGLSVRRMKDSKFNGEYVLPQIDMVRIPHENIADDGTKYKHHRRLGGQTEKDAQKKLEYLHTRWEKVPATLKREWVRVHSRRPEDPFSQLHIFAELLLARLAAIHPLIHLRESRNPCASTSGSMKIDDWKELMKKDENWRSSHIDTVVGIVKQHIEDPESGGLIVFSQYIAPLDLVEIAIKQKFGRDCLRYDGSVSDKIKQRNMERFKHQFDDDSGERDGPLIMLMTSGSAAEGHNIPQANRCIILGPSFNPAIDAQSWHRILRRGQLRRCYLHILILHGSYEDRNFFIQDRKLNNSESVLDLTTEQIEHARAWTEEQFKSFMLIMVSEKVMSSEPVEKQPVVHVEMPDLQLKQNLGTEESEGQGAELGVGEVAELRESLKAHEKEYQDVEDDDEDKDEDENEDKGDDGDENEMMMTTEMDLDVAPYQQF